MEDWQFFNVSRLAEIHQLEEETYSTLKANKSLPPIGPNGKLQVLSEEVQAEKDRLLAEGKADWTRPHYSAFVKVFIFSIIFSSSIIISLCIYIFISCERI